MTPSFKKHFLRPSGFRDSKLFIIATEGAETEIQYFEGLREELHNPKIHVEILIRKDPSLSAPEYVIKELNQFKKKYSIHKDDELWMVIDYDRWGIPKLSQINTLCRQKKYFIAVSNPKFELWLLYHFVADSRIREEDTLEVQIREVLGSFNSSNIDFDRFKDHIQAAVKNAELVDDGNDWPNNRGTHVFKLVDKILNVIS